MAHIKSPLMELLAISSITAILAVTALQPAKGYLEKTRKAAIEEEISNCVKELAYDNVFNDTSTLKCSINSSKDNLTLFYNKKKNVVFSKKKIFHFEFGRDIECIVSDSKIICEFLEN